MEDIKYDIILAAKTRIKRTLQNILHSDKFCGLCLDTVNDMNFIEEQFEITVHEEILNVSLHEIICTVFKNVEDTLSSCYICSKCLDTLLLSYKFIENAQAVAKTLQTHLKDLCNKVTGATDVLKTQVKLACSHVVIVIGDRQEPNDQADGSSMNGDSMKIETEDVEQDYMCGECKIILPSRQKLELHHHERHQKELQCTFCSKKCKSVNALNSHYKKIHSSILCKICHDVIYHANVVRHLKDKHRESTFFCSLCKVISYSATALEAHMKNSHPVANKNRCVMCLKTLGRKLSSHRCKFMCPECVKMPCVHYKYLMSYRQQQLDKQTKIKCMDCDYVCTKKLTLVGHANRVHLNRYLFTCDYCQRQFYTKKLLAAHIHQVHMEWYKCEFCDKSFRRKAVYQDHRETCKLYQKEFSCEGCVASFETAKQLAEHVQVRHIEDWFPCEICGKKFLSDRQRNGHVSKAHGPTNTILNVKCGLCDVSFENKSVMRLHMKRHGSNPRYRCKICNSDFRNLDYLNNHIYKHTAPTATCEKCGRVILRIYLKKHLESHMPPKFYTCDSCGRCVRGLNQYKYHLKQHLTCVACPDCKMLLQPANLRRHRLSYHSDRSQSKKLKKKTMKCEYCDYAATTKMQIECHTNKHHTKVKPYNCHVCDKKFTGRHLLLRHVKRHAQNSDARTTRITPLIHL